MKIKPGLNHLYILLFIIAILAGVGFYLYRVFTSYSYSFRDIKRYEDQYFKGEARENEYLAFAKLLQESEYNVTKLNEVHYLYHYPFRNGVVVFSGSPKFLGESNLDYFFEGARQGGHFIYNAGRAFYSRFDGEQQDSILKRLDLRIVNLGYDNACMEKLKNSCYSDNDDYGKMNSFSGAEQRKVFFDPHLTLSTTREDHIAKVSSDCAIHMLRYKYGKGIITVVTELSMLTNDRILYDDNLLFGVDMVSTGIGSDRNKEFWYLNVRGIPNIMDLIWYRGWMLILTVLVFIIAFLIIRGRRFGPIDKPVGVVRRQLQDHLDAASLFAWNSNGYQYILESVRKRVLTSLTKRFSHIQGMKIGDICKFIAAEYDMDLSQVDRAFRMNAAQIGNDSVMFTQIVKQLEKFDSTLSRSGND